MQAKEYFAIKFKKALLEILNWV